VDRWTVKRYSVAAKLTGAPSAGPRYFLELPPGFGTALPLFAHMRVALEAAKLMQPSAAPCLLGHDRGRGAPWIAPHGLHVSDAITRRFHSRLKIAPVHLARTLPRLFLNTFKFDHILLGGGPELAELWRHTVLRCLRERDTR
jgi:hypothetical protein